MFQQYYQKGILLIPEKESRPLVKWAKFHKTDERPSKRELAEWDLWTEVNYGLLTGLPSGVVAVDIDIDDKNLIERIRKSLGDTPCAKFGTKGITLFYKYNGEKSKVYDKVELKSTGGKVTIPPSKLPEYKLKELEGDKRGCESYVWIGESLIDSIDKLPYLPNNYNDKLNSLLNIIEKEPEYKIKPKVSFKSDFTENDIETALGYLSADCDYSTWSAIGACLYNELGDTGFYYFDKWSSSSSKYDQSLMKAHWRGCKAYDRYTIGTLIYLAKENGYTPKEIEIKQADERKLAREKIEEERKELVEYPDFYREAPEHIRAIADWICSSAYIPQPVLSLGMACGLVGFTLMGKYKFKGIKSNLYCVNLAKTATGKEHILQCANGLLNALNLKGLHTGSRFSGDTAVIADLKRTKGMLCYVADEVQALLKTISSGHQSTGDAEELFLSCYTGIEAHGKTYANKKDTEEKGGTIKNPFMSILGFTTPASFYSSIGTAQKGSGLVGRLTVFEGLKLLPEEPNEKYDGEAPNHPPSPVVDYLKRVIENTYTTFSYNGAKMPIEKPIEVMCDENVQKELKELQREIFKERNELEMMGDSDAQTPLLRKTEMIKKYCLIASCGELITIDHYNWAVKMAEYNGSIMLKAVGEFGSYEFAGKVQKLLEYIQARGAVSKAQVVNSLRIFKDSDERNKAIRELQETEKIKEVTIGGKGKQKLRGYAIINP